MCWRGGTSAWSWSSGPCSIHDTKAAREYADQLKEVSDEFSNELIVVMRVYFEKPRTTIGWKGLINDPYLDQSYKINDGLRLARRLLLDLAEMGMPAGTEFLDMISPQYVAALVSWGAIGARTTESQIHRQLVSGLSCPVGFKNATSGDVQIAIEAMLSAAHPHTFLGVFEVRAVGHPVHQRQSGYACDSARRQQDGELHAEAVAEVCAGWRNVKQKPQVMIDCSHANSQKDHNRQPVVCRDVAAQVAGGGQPHHRRDDRKQPWWRARRRWWQASR